MRTVALIFFLPSLVYANCGCDEVWKEIAKERAEDIKFHECRNCKALELSNMDISACPDSGYECNAIWEMTTTSKLLVAHRFSRRSVLYHTVIAVLKDADACECAEARCAGTARLAFEKHIVNKMRCNNSQWIVGDKAAKPVVCAKSCDTGACRASHPKASTDYKPLTVKPSDVENRCARGVCEPDYGMSALNADGSLFRPLPGITEVFCTGDGIWRSIGPYVMCNASPSCGPGRCPAFIDGPAKASGAVVPLTVTDNGMQCASATCTDGFVIMNPDGTMGAEVPTGTFSQLNCLPDIGHWFSDNRMTFLYVMCKPKPNCAAITHFDPSLCTATFGQSAVCTPAAITETSVSCDVVGSTLAGATTVSPVFLDPPRNALKCDGTYWAIVSNGVQLFNTAAQLLCYTKKTEPQCASIIAFDLTKCTTIDANAVCTAATVTSSSVTCPAGSMLAGKTPNYNIRQQPTESELKCEGTFWTVVSTGLTLFDTTAELLCYTITSEPTCKKCPATLVTPSGFESDTTDNTGDCSERSLVCAKTVVLYNGGIRFTTPTNGKVIFPITCNADGTAWMLDDSTITGPIQCTT